MGRCQHGGDEESGCSICEEWAELRKRSREADELELENEHLRWKLDELRKEICRIDNNVPIRSEDSIEGEDLKQLFVILNYTRDDGP